MDAQRTGIPEKKDQIRKPQTKKRKRPVKELQTDLSMNADGNRGITIPCTEEQYTEIIKTLWYGTYTIRRNRTIAVILQTEANTGLRIGDVMRLTLDSIIFDNGRYRFHIQEHKTKKFRTFTVPNPVYNMLYRYAKANGIKPNALLFPMSVRNVQKKLDQVTDYLGYRYISSHSFRKFFACRCYSESNNDINLVRTLLQHSDTATTIRYLGVSEDKVEKVLRKVVMIVESHWDDSKNTMDDDDTIDHVDYKVSSSALIRMSCEVSKALVDRLVMYSSISDTAVDTLVELALNEFIINHEPQEVLV